MVDYIVGAILLLIIAGAVWYVIKSKRNGKKCIGCPSGDCSKCGCSCGMDNKEKK